MFFAILFNFRRIRFIVYWAKNYQLQKVFVKKQSMKKKNDVWILTMNHCCTQKLDSLTNNISDY